MVIKEKEKIKEAAIQLEEALKRYDNRTKGDKLPILTVMKAFEVLVEYGWKYLKHSIETEGLFAQSPKEAIRQAGKLNIIKDTEIWINSINVRNDSVHDYFGIPEPDYVAYTKIFLAEIRKDLL